MELSEQLGQRLDLAGFTMGAEEGDAADASVLGRLVRLLSDVSGTDPESIEEGMTLSEAGVSSLDRIELAVRAENEFGARADDGPYPDNPTVGEVAGWLEENGRD
ncbi:acyl carrier protein [Corynebacterium mycetoides]|uniref:Acyl carrier protein n=1 Tax=Corynebacterium mycetoides TaxID=38302 RepID=A0A1G9NEZ3_9CORY|nr:acyl carrier protein [Corynebacterium mycetoides]SDL85072.1 acyl carrier protein [Corynebacterium mycetoides]